MIWRSVVGKLWLTIIGLVTLVLVILYLLLGQFIYKYYVEEQSQNLKTLAIRLADVFSEHTNQNELMIASKELVSAFNTRLSVINSDLQEIQSISRDPSFPEIPANQLFSPDQLNSLIAGRTIVNQPRVGLPYSNVNISAPNNQTSQELLAVASPIILQGRVSGALILYQSLDTINNTTAGTKQMIFYAAVIGILLTTFFAFFLSNRITQPLLQMKKAANLLTQGEYGTRVPLNSTDEIRDLAESFNQMASRLDETIHALSQEKEHLSSILRSMVDAVVSVDSSGRVILTNPPADNILHTWSEESAPKLRGHIPVQLQTIFRSVMKEEIEQAGDITVHGRTWSFVMAPLYAREQLRGAVAVLRDVTEERRSDKLRKDFVANISHELRTPLAMLQGYSEALIDDIADSPEERKEIAQVIQDESLRMGRLVKDLLDLAKMEAGHIQLHTAPVHLPQLVIRMERKFAALLKERGLRFQRFSSKEEMVLLLDEDRIEQVFTNLIDNAIRHTPVGGTITVRISEFNQGVRIDVQDSGSGIPEEDLPFIFERFYKADKARTRGSSGTGLGLSIVKNIVEAHGGSVSAQSEEGEGTTFSIILPL